MITFKGVLLEISTGEYMGVKYAKAKVRSANVALGKILSYGVDISRVKADDLIKFQDKQVDIVAEIVKGKDDKAALKVVDVQLSK